MKTDLGMEEEQLMCRLYKFKIWDKKHDRWFHGDTNPEHARFGTDAIDLFGEVIVFGEILHGFNPFVIGCYECLAPEGDEVEVLGNIHENPDLLEEKK